MGDLCYGYIWGARAATFTAHRTLRHTALGIQTGVRGSSEMEKKWKSGNNVYKIKNEQVAEILKKTVEMFKLTYNKPGANDNRHWWGTMAPILSIGSLFKVRKDELRVGHNKMAVGIDPQGNMKTVNISSWGLGPEHHILLEGITMPPSKRSAIAQSLGPMTSLISLAKQKGQEKYEGKWANAAKRSLQHIPDTDDIIRAMKGKKASEVRELMKAITDVALITETREANRASFPWNALTMVLLSAKEFKYYSIVGLNNEFTNTALEGTIGLRIPIDYSGKGCYLTYNAITKLELGLPGNMTSDQATQIIFHSIFGSYKEDLSLFANVTDRQIWNDRSRTRSGKSATV